MNDQEVMYLIDALVVALIGFAFLIYIQWTRHKNQQLALDCILVETWPDAGPVKYEMYPYKGNEIYLHKNALKMIREGNVKELELVPRAYIEKDAVGLDFWPKPFGIVGRLTSVQVPKVILFEKDPEPMSRRRIKVFQINPKTQEREITWVNKSVPIATQETLGAYRDESFTLWSATYEKEIDELKMKLIKVLATRINPMFIYIALGISILSIGVSLYLHYQTLNDIADLKSGAGI